MAIPYSSIYTKLIPANFAYKLANVAIPNPENIQYMSLILYRCHLMDSLGAAIYSMTENRTKRKSNTMLIVVDSHKKAIKT